MRMQRDETGEGVDRPSWRSSVPGDPGAKFLCGKLGIGTKKEKRGKKKERPVGTVGGNKSFTGGTNGSEERMPEGSRVSCSLGTCGEFSTTANALLTSSNTVSASFGHLSECATSQDWSSNRVLRQFFRRTRYFISISGRPRTLGFRYGEE